MILRDGCYWKDRQPTTDELLAGAIAGGRIVLLTEGPLAGYPAKFFYSVGWPERIWAVQDGYWNAYYSLGLGTPGEDSEWAPAYIVALVKGFIK